MPVKKLHLTVTWIIFASFVMVAAVWQAQVAVAREIAAKHKLPPPPKRIMSVQRENQQAIRVDPVEDYQARCAKGMTDQQILWVLEDYKIAGLDNPPHGNLVTKEQIAEFRFRQYHWYRDILVEGLRLTREQSMQILKKFPEIFNATTQGFPLHAGTVDTQALGYSGWLTGWEQSDPFRDPRLPVSKGYPPWVLCDLTPEQASITWMAWAKKTDEAGGRAIENGDSAMATVPSDGSKPPHEGSTLLFPTPNGEGVDREDIPSWIVHAGSVMPLQANQSLQFAPDYSDPFSTQMENAKTRFLEDIRRLHPAQLRTLLLIQPGIIGTIQTALDEKSGG